MIRLVKPVTFDVSAVKRRARFSFSDTGGVKVLVFQRKLYEVFLRPEVLDVAGSSVNISAAVATEEALLQ